MRRLPGGVFKVSYEQELAVIHTRFQWTAFGVFVVFVVLLPFLVSPGWLDFFIRIGLTLVSLFGLNLLVGYCGQLSLGHAAFMAVGAFSGAIALKAGVPYAVALAVAGSVAGLTGLVAGLPALRLRGLYLAFATLAAHFVIVFVLVRYSGGDRGHLIRPPVIAGIVLGADARFYFLVLALTALAAFCCQSLVRAKTGRAFVAIRDHDIAASTLGINVYYYKLLAFFISSFYAGVGGLLLSSYYGWATVDQFTLWNAVWYVGMLMVGGVGTITGPYFGAFFVVGLDQLSSILAPVVGRALPALAGTVIGALPVIAFSLALLVFIICEPRGIAHRWEILKSSARVFPFAY